jgi:phosphatidylglycerol:prolipoprotein diacylglycerol transferase
MAEILFPGWDPVLLDLGFLQLRWYGLMYVAGFLIGQRILLRLARARFLPLTERQVDSLIVWLVLGVILGGRLGFATFYSPELWADPLKLIRIWEGGLAFHGGLLGVCVAFVLFARKHGVAPLRLGDGLALAVTPGIFAVRLANFLNGELYGRVATGALPWGIRFPTDPAALEMLAVPKDATMRERELLVLRAYEDGTWSRIRDAVPLRHPSQLYEALAEGLLLGLALLLVYRATRRRPFGPGAYGGLFLIGYGLARFVVEWFRQPDAQFRAPGNELGTVWLGLSMGQLLCLGMSAIGAAVLLVGLRQPRLETAAA